MLLEQTYCKETIAILVKRLINNNNLNLYDRQAMTSWNMIHTTMEEEQCCDGLALEEGDLKRWKEEIFVIWWPCVGGCVCVWVGVGVEYDYNENKGFKYF